MDVIETKEGLQQIADRLIDEIRSENLPIWQAKEVFKYAAARLDNEILK